MHVCYEVLHPFVHNAPFLYPLKTSENRKVSRSDFWGVEKGCIGNKWVNKQMKLNRCDWMEDQLLILSLPINMLTNNCHNKNNCDTKIGLIKAKTAHS